MSIGTASCAGGHGGTGRRPGEIRLALPDTAPHRCRSPYSRVRSPLCLCFVLGRPQSSLPDVPLGPAGRCGAPGPTAVGPRSEEHTSELQSRQYLVCRLLLEKKKLCLKLYILLI